MAKPKAYDYLFDITLIGDSYVGKTCLISRFCDSVFSTIYQMTARVDFNFRTIDLDGKKISLQLCDISGYEPNTPMLRCFYRNALGIMIVYDVTKEKSFDNITYWIHNIKEHAPEDVERILIGNKCDMQERKVEREKGENLAREHGFLFFETSAKENINVEEAFEFLARCMKAKADAKPDLPQHTGPPVPKSSQNDKPRPSFPSSCSLI